MTREHLWATREHLLTTREHLLAIALTHPLALSQVAELQRSIQRFQKEGETHDAQRKTALQELEAKLTTVNSQCKLYEEQHLSAADGLGTLKAGIARIFESPMCETSVLADVLGNSEVSEANVMSFLGAIEQVRDGE